MFLSICGGAATDLHHTRISDHAQFLEDLVNHLQLAPQGCGETRDGVFQMEVCQICGVPFAG